MHNHRYSLQWLPVELSTLNVKEEGKKTKTQFKKTCKFLLNIILRIEQENGKQRKAFVGSEFQSSDELKMKNWRN